MLTIPLAPVDAVRITILMDNVTDPLLFPSEGVDRVTWLDQLAERRMTSAVTADGLPDALIAEPGFSALVRVTTGGRCPRPAAPHSRARASRSSRSSNVPSCSTGRCS